MAQPAIAGRGPLGVKARHPRGAAAAPLPAGIWGTGTLTEAEIHDLVAQMTLTEKIGMVQGAPDSTCSGAYVSPGVQGCMGQAGYVPGVARLGIPPLRLSDGPAGVKLVHVATALPAPVGLAATFDREAARAYGQVMGREGRALNQDVILAPMINQVSIPTAGRNFETLGEDPYLTGEMVRNEVEGIQGEGLIATLKHYAMNDFENGRNSTSVSIDPDLLHETELQGFREGIAAGAGAVMCAYPRVNDVYACSSEALLDGILRDVYGFTGWVVSDWGATRRSSDLIHGLDMAMPSGNAFNGWDPSILSAAASGGTPAIPMTNDLPAVPAYSPAEWSEALDRAVFRILLQMNNARLLEGTLHGSAYTGGPPWVPPRPDLEALRAEHLAVAEGLAARSAVLMKNDQGVLPLAPDDFLDGSPRGGVLVVGPAAVAPYAGGWGSAHVRPWDPLPGPYEALVAAAPPGGRIDYLPGWDLDGEVIPSDALAAPDFGNPNPDWTLRAEDEVFSGEPGLLRQQITTSSVPSGAQPVLYAGPNGAPDQLDEVIDYTGADSLPASTAWRWTGTFTAPAAGEWQLKVFVSRGTQAHLFVDGLESADEVIPIRAYPVPPWVSYATLDHVQRSHDLSAPGLQQETWTVDLATGQVLHLDLRLVTDQAGPSQIQLRWIPPGWQDARIAEAAAAAAGARKVVVFLVDPGFEGRDRGGDNPVSGLSLTGPQDALVSALAAACPATIAVLNVGAPVLMPWAGEVEGILSMWYPGQAGGAATARVLMGIDNPGGRLPVTFPPGATLFPQFDPGCTDPSINGDCPLYPGRAEPGFLGAAPHGYRTIDFGTNGIFVGYRWYEEEGIVPAYPFGHGLSYTTFEYGDLRLSRARRGGMNVWLSVRNTGPVAGDEVVQVYLGPSDHGPAGAPQAARRLVQFERVTLEPGERRDVTLYVEPRELSLWSPVDQAWRSAGGQRMVYVGSSSRDIRLESPVRLGP